MVTGLPIWQKYIESVSGFVLPDVQHNWLARAVEATAKQYEMPPELLYHAVLKDEKISQSLLDAILIPESRFFRHEPSLDFIGEIYTKAIQKKAGHFDVWSVGCSMGQEVYSVAMTLSLLEKLYPDCPPFLVNGSDLSQRSLDVARLAEYGDRQVSQIPSRCRHYVKNISENNQPLWQIQESLRKKTHFFWHNVFLKKPTTLPKQDIILCQNVLIYFRKFDQRDILSYFVKYVKVGGYVVLAPNEAVFWQHPKMKRVDSNVINAWQKIAD